MIAKLLLGDEAVAQGAIDAGIAGAFSYPGTPATEDLRVHRARGPVPRGISARWSANEKVAYEEALGMSYAGGRAIVSMKHVGLNVAADPFVNSALTGVNGGLVLVVADDPGMHSSQNEQDSRFYAEFAQMPDVRAVNQQEAYDLTRARLRLLRSDRPAGRRAPRDAPVAQPRECRDRPPAPGDAARSKRRPLPTPGDWTLVPAIARQRFAKLIEAQKRLLDDSERDPANRLTLAGRFGVIAAGIAHNYVQEALHGTGGLSVLKIGHYPLPVALVRELVDHCDEILVAEDGYPFIEQRLNGLLGLPGKAIRGRLDGRAARQRRADAGHSRSRAGPERRAGRLGAGRRPGRAAAAALPRLPARRQLQGHRRGHRRLPEPDPVQRHRLLHARRDAALPGRPLLRRHGRVDRDGPRRGAGRRASRASARSAIRRSRTPA